MGEEEQSEDVYDKKGREAQTEDAEISPEEAAFMKGYEDDEDESIAGKDKEEE